MTAPLRPLSPRRPGQPSAAQRPAPQSAAPQQAAGQAGASPYLRPPTTFAGMAQRGMPRPPRPQPMQRPMMAQPPMQPAMQPQMQPSNAAQNPTVPRTFQPSQTPYQGQQDHAISQWLANPSAYNSSVVQGTYGVLDRQITNQGRTAARGIDNAMAARGLRVSTPARTEHGNLAVELDRNRRDAAQTLVDTQARDYASARANSIAAAQAGTQQAYDRDATTFGLNEGAIGDAFARGLAGRQQGVTERRLDLDTELGRGDLALRRTLGVGALDVDWARLASGESQFGANLAENQRQYNMGDWREGQRIGIARDAADSNFYQGAAGLFATALGNPQLAAALRAAGLGNGNGNGSGTNTPPSTSEIRGQLGGAGVPQDDIDRQFPGSVGAVGGTPSMAQRVASQMTRASAPDLANLGGMGGQIGNGPMPGAPSLTPPANPFPSYGGTGMLYGGQQGGAPQGAPQGGPQGGTQPYFAGWANSYPATSIPQYGAPTQGGTAQPYISPLQGWVPSWRQQGASGAPGAPAGGSAGGPGAPGLPGGSGAPGGAPGASAPASGGQNEWRFGQPWSPSRPVGPPDVAPQHRPGAPNLDPYAQGQDAGPNAQAAAWLAQLEREARVTPQNQYDVVESGPYDPRLTGEAFDRQWETMRAGRDYDAEAGGMVTPGYRAARWEAPRVQADYDAFMDRVMSGQGSVPAAYQAMYDAGSLPGDPAEQQALLRRLAEEEFLRSTGVAANNPFLTRRA